MANSAGEVRLTLSGDNRPLLGALAGAERGIVGLERQATSSFTTISRVAATATTALIGGLAVLGRQAINAAGDVQKGNLALQALGKSQGYARSEIAATVKTIKEGGIETMVAQEAATTFMQSNLELADAAKIAAHAQNIAVAANENSTETFRQLAYAIQTGGTQLNVFRKLQIQAGREYTKYADTLGKSAERLTQVERSQALVNAVMREGGKFAGLYEQAQRESFSKIQDSFKRYKQEAMEAFGTPFLGAFFQWTKLKQHIISGLDTLVQKTGVLKDIGRQIEATLVPAVAKVKAWMEKLADSPAWKTLSKGIGMVFKLLTENAAAAGIGLAAVGGATATLLGTVTQGIPVIGGLANAIGRHGVAFGVVGSLVALMASTEAGRASLKNIGGAFSSVAKQALPPLLKLVQALAEAVAKVSAPALAGAAQALVGMVPAFSALVQVAASLVTTLGPVVSLIGRIPPMAFTAVAAFVAWNKIWGLVNKASGLLGGKLGGLQARLMGTVGASKSAETAGLRVISIFNRERDAAYAAAAAIKAKNVAAAAPVPIAGGAGAVVGGVRHHPLTQVGVNRGPGTGHGTSGLGMVGRTAKNVADSTADATKSAGKLSGIMAGLGGGPMIAVTAAMTAATIIAGQWSKHQANIAESAARFSAQVSKGWKTDTVKGLQNALKDASKYTKLLTEDMSEARKELGVWGGSGLLPKIGRGFMDFIGHDGAEAFNRAQARAKDFRGVVVGLRGKARELRDELQKMDEDGALRKAADDANALKEAMDTALSTLAGLASQALSQLNAEIAESSGANALVTRSIGQVTAATNEMSAAGERFIGVLGKQGVSTKTVAAEQNRLVDAIVRNARATADHALSEKEMASIRQDAIRQVAELTRQEQQARQERELANFSLIASFDLLKDSIRTLESLQERGKEAAQSLMPDPSVEAAYGAIQKKITSLTDEFAQRTKQNAAVQATFVADVNKLARAGHLAFAHELIEMGIEGAALAAEAAGRVTSGQGLGGLDAAMGAAAKAGKAAFDKNAITWGPNMQGMATKAKSKLVKVLDDVPKAMSDIADLSSAELARFGEIFAKNIDQHQKWVDSINDIAKDGQGELAFVLKAMGPEAGRLAGNIADAIKGQGRSGIAGTSEKIREALKVMATAKGPFVTEITSWKTKAEELGEAAVTGIKDGMNKTRGEIRSELDEIEKLIEQFNRKIKALARVRDEGEQGGGGWGAFFKGWVDFGKSWKNLHGGGPVPGSGDVPIMAEGGEWMLSKQQVALIGKGNLAKLPKFHGGGPVPAGGGGGGGGGMVVNIPITVQGNVVGDGYEKITEAVRAGLAKAQYRNGNVGLRSRAKAGR